MGNTLLLIPGLGYIMDTNIKGIVASIIIYSAGKLCIKYSEENFEKINALEFYKNIGTNYNSAMDSLKTISDNFNEIKLFKFT